MEFVWVSLVLIGGLTAISLVKWLIDVGCERKGSWLRVSEVINAICILLIVPVSAFALFIGAERVWKESWQLGLVCGGALAFVVYFYVAKNESKTKHENSHTLTPKTAEEIVQQYGAALARGTPEGGIARPESYLPCSKERIKQAAKLFLAFQIEYKSLLKEPTENLLGAISALNSFIPDHEADRINQGDRSLGNTEYWDFTKRMFGLELREEMDGFIAEVQKMDADDPIYHQRVYTLAGLEYSRKVEKDYLDIFLNR